VGTGCTVADPGPDHVTGFFAVSLARPQTGIATAPDRLLRWL